MVGSKPPTCRGRLVQPTAVCLCLAGPGPLVVHCPVGGAQSRAPLWTLRWRAAVGLRRKGVALLMGPSRGPRCGISEGALLRRQQSRWVRRPALWGPVGGPFGGCSRGRCPSFPLLVVARCQQLALVRSRAGWLSGGAWVLGWAAAPAQPALRQAGNSLEAFRGGHRVLSLSPLPDTCGHGLLGARSRFVCCRRSWR